ncbi:RagB/SusD family nutrient uptake outer membrane protein [Bacteroides heparinolyticus]|uniref:RagB/SusD family nutrient uptake outer membrane protein n=2 Tax=Prevotella heparinolytica TaxID=28113 RepID=UPI0023F05133|nr:RagB/SusD family nutrient uptake outer membrane protein [Bacteroides heparinolyticus]MCF0255102.1 RagB/SusD family nutrient uptake outer membrane protein [Bacteroides heparinolyticus]
MKLKNILLATIATSAFVVGGTSCNESFLEEKMFSSYGPDITDVNAKLIGLHRQYAAIWGMSGQQGFVGCWQVGTDVGAPGDTQGVEVPFYRYQELNAENAGISFLWEKLYELIDSANLIIASQSEGGDTAAMSEAMFFRAYAYNLLVTLWGDVPLVTVSTTIPRTDYTREEVYKVDEVIDSDLTYAINNLPAVGAAKSESRINQDMARQLAGEAYLRMGMRDASYFKKAEDAVNPIIMGGKYKLISERYGKFVAESGDYYHDMFRWGNQRRSQGNTEAIWIFEMEYNRNVNGGTIDNPQQRRNWVPAFHKLDGMVNADSIGGRGNGRLRLSNFVKYGLYDKGDIRNSNFNIRRVMWYNKPGFSKEFGIDANGFLVDKDKGVKNVVLKTGNQVIPHIGDTLNVFYPHTTKWGAYDATDDFGYAMVKDWPLMRLGETYLLRAEARFRQGNVQGAADDINVLRDRAFKDYRTIAPEAGKVKVDQINIDFILDERIRELIGEENRRSTLMRAGELANRVNMMASKWNETVDSKKISGFSASKHLLLPIPLTEIQLNKDGNLKQNPGY